jgi:Patatin-like phospholipase
MPVCDPIGWPQSSAAQYCKRLAVISRPFLCGLSATDRKLLPESFIKAIQESPDKNNLSDDEIALALYKSPPLQARLAVITQYTTSKWLLEQELKARGKWAKNPDGTYRYGPEDDAYFIAADPEHPTVGLCLSGGGIRSATFALGVLQGLARVKLLSKFDYLSSVSGGGYIHQFLAAWIYRKGSLDAVQYMMDPLPNCVHGDGAPDSDYATVQPEPIRWLRRYSNYLAPQRGVFSADTWTLVAIIVRNAGLNLFTLISMLLAILILPHMVISQTHIDFVRNRHLLAETGFSTGRFVEMALLVLAILVASVSAAASSGLLRTSREALRESSGLLARPPFLALFLRRSWSPS